METTNRDRILDHRYLRWSGVRQESLAASAFVRMVSVMLVCTALTPWLTARATGLGEDRDLRGQNDRFHQAQPPSPWVKPQTGAFLVASRALTDPHFRKSVVLLIENKPSGSAGLIINRATQVPVSLALPQIPELAKKNHTVHIGGPVALNSIILLVKTRHRLSEAKPIVGDLYLATSENVARKLVKWPPTAVRYYAGYAGWGAGQLEFELQQGSWYLSRVDTDLIFERKAEEVWPELIRRAESVWTCRCPLKSSSNEVKPPAV